MVEFETSGPRPGRENRSGRGGERPFQSSGESTVTTRMSSAYTAMKPPRARMWKITRKISNADTGWRELKRLLEVKYVVGGWDFQIAVVRRH